jgi:hypothetical protein
MSLSRLIHRSLVLSLFLAGSPGISSSGAQTKLPSIQPEDVARRRTEKAVERQTKGLAAMAGSIEIQKLSVERQRRNQHLAGFSDFQTPRYFVSGVAPVACDSLPEANIDNLVNEAAERSSVSPELIRSVMKQESGFRPCAVSPKGAIGLMQLLPATASDLGVKDPFDPEANVLGGTRFLKQLIDRYGGNLSLTLGAYNAGPGRVDAAMKVPMIPETLNYVDSILSGLAAEYSKPPVTTEGPDLSADQFVRDNAADISLRLIGPAGGE